MSIIDMKFFRFLGFKKKPNAPWSKYYQKGYESLYSRYFFMITLKEI